MEKLMKDPTVLMIGAGALAFIGVRYFLKKKEEEKANIGGTRIGSRTGISTNRYNASACLNPQLNKMYVSCGSTCPNGHSRLGSANKFGC